MITKKISSLKQIPFQIFDTHAHYNHHKYNQERDQILFDLEKKGITVANIATNTKSIQETLLLSKKHKNVYSVLGYFPTDVFELENSKNIAYLRTSLKEEKVVAIGEIGLDYFWLQKKEGLPSKEKQEKWFRYQLNLAKEFNLPVSIHSRDAKNDTIKILHSEKPNLKGVIHCFSYDTKTAIECIEMGFYLGIDGNMTYKNAIQQEVLKTISLDDIVLETDAPYLTPEPIRRELNNSINLLLVADKIAEIKGTTRNIVLEKTYQNALNLYKIKQ